MNDCDDTCPGTAAHRALTGAGRYQKAAQRASGIPHSSEWPVAEFRRQLTELGVPEVYHDAAIKVALAQAADHEAEYERDRLADQDTPDTLS